MPRSSLLLFILFAVGCSAPDRELVYVDRNQALATVPVEARPTTPKVETPAGVPASQASVPAMPQRTVSIGNAQQRLARASQVIAKNRADALEQITRELSETYRKEVARIARERKDAMDEDRLRGYGDVVDRLSERFERYAHERGPKIARLALLANFPDEDPGSKRQAPERQRIEAERLAEAKRLRSEIAALDAEYRKDASLLVASVDARYREDLVAFERELESMRIDADRRAANEAQKQLEAEFKLSSILEGRATRRLPAEPAQSVTISGSGAFPAPPEVAQLESVGRLQALQNELVVWAETHHYRLADAPKGARDATQEFVQWKRERTPGP